MTKEKKLNSDSDMPPGIAFEKLVAAIQSKIDPTATVSHNQKIIDRLGQSRQFDVVVQGRFAGQKILGVIECKDLRRPVGVSEIDAFATKSQDVHANISILVSRKGFTKPALEKCRHYNIQPLSLINDDDANDQLFIGTLWLAEKSTFTELKMQLSLEPPAPENIQYSIEDVKINGKNIIDWYTNILLSEGPHIMDDGWIAEKTINFGENQSILVAGNIYQCKGVSFHAHRVREKFQKLAGIGGQGFFDWNSKSVTLAPGDMISDVVPLDFTQWSAQSEVKMAIDPLLIVNLTTRTEQFSFEHDAIDLLAI